MLLKHIIFPVLIYMNVRAIAVSDSGHWQIQPQPTPHIVGTITSNKIMDPRYVRWMDTWVSQVLQLVHAGKMHEAQVLVAEARDKYKPNFLYHCFARTGLWNVPNTELSRFGNFQPTALEVQKYAWLCILALHRKDQRLMGGMIEEFCNNRKVVRGIDADLYVKMARRVVKIGGPKPYSFGDLAFAYRHAGRAEDALRTQVDAISASFASMNSGYMTYELSQLDEYVRSYLTAPN